MLHLAFLISLISLLTGIASITTALLVYLRHRKRVVLYYCGMVTVIALLTVRRGMQHYGLLTGLDDVPGFAGAGMIVERLAYVTGILVGPLFTHYLIGDEIDRTRRIIYAAVAGIFVVVTALEVLVPESGPDLNHWVSLPILYGMFGYCMILGALRFGRVGSKTLDAALRAFFIAAIAVLPLSFYQYLTQRPYLPFFMETPLAFLIVNTAAIVFAYRYFNQAPFLERGSLSGHFKVKFSVTDRESEIIVMLLRGAQNSEIADKLFISVRTVESHLYNIFQKTSVKNRLQLVNLIQTNSI